MKQIILPILFGCALPALSIAGNHSPGSVSISPNKSMVGSMNVRHNDSQSGFMTSTAKSNFVDFYGVDNQGDYFYCSVLQNESDPEDFQYALDVANSLTDGSRLTVYKNQLTNRCSSITHSKQSARQQ